MFHIGSHSLLHHRHEDGGEAILAEITSSEGAARVRRTVAVGCAVNALLMAAKLLTGYFGHSDALMADGVHSLNDFAADLIMLLFVGISFRNPDRRYAYGYGKFETFSSFLISAFLIVIGAMMFVGGCQGVADFCKGERLPRPDIWTVVVIVVAMCAKECLYRYYSSAGRRIGSSALLANAWHHRMDAMSSVATLIGVSCSHFFGDNWRVLDPCVTILISLIIIQAASRMLRPAFTELMERSLPLHQRSRAEEVIGKCNGVKTIETVRTRRNGHTLIFDVSIGVDPQLTVEQGAAVAASVTRALEAAFGTSILVSVSTHPAAQPLSRI